MKILEQDLLWETSGHQRKLQEVFIENTCVEKHIQLHFYVILNTYSYVEVQLLL